MTDPSPRVASVAVLIGAVLWGLYWIPVRLLEGEGIGAATTVALLNAPAAIATAIWTRRTWHAQKPVLRQVILIGFVAGTALALYGVSIAYTSVIRATLLFYLMPIWATLIGVIWLGERVDWRRGLAIVLGLGGLALLMMLSVEENRLYGDILAFLSGVFWAVSTALIKRLGPAPIGGMMAAQFVSVTVVALIIGLAVGDALSFATLAKTPAVWIALAASLFGVLPAIALMFWASQFLFPGRVGLLLMAEIVVAVVTASIFLPEERLQSLQWFAVVLIIGAAMVEFIPNKRVQKT